MSDEKLSAAEYFGKPVPGVEATNQGPMPVVEIDGRQVKLMRTRIVHTPMEFSASSLKQLFGVTDPAREGFEPGEWGYGWKIKGEVSRYADTGEPVEHPTHWHEVSPGDVPQKNSGLTGVPGGRRVFRAYFRAWVSWLRRLVRW